MSTYNSLWGNEPEYEPTPYVPAQRKIKNRYNTSGERPYDITKEQPVRVKASEIEDICKEDNQFEG